MATYKTEYETVMHGMRGAELRDYELTGDYCGQQNCASLLDVMSVLANMERGDVRHMTACLPTGLTVMGTEQAAIECMEAIHPDNMPTAYEVRRNTRGYAVRLMYSND